MYIHGAYTRKEGKYTIHCDYLEEKEKLAQTMEPVGEREMGTWYGCDATNIRVSGAVILLEPAKSDEAVKSF